jgi:Arc/MetJ-type ribon-helix-helix transcriptional regulator
MYYNTPMKTLTVRLPEALVAEIEAESRERRRSKSDVVRERLSMGKRSASKGALPAVIADIVGAVDGLPADLSSRKKAYLKKGYGRNRTR